MNFVCEAYLIKEEICRRTEGRKRDMSADILDKEEVSMLVRLGRSTYITCYPSSLEETGSGPL